MNRVVNIDYEFVDVLSTYTFDMKNYSNKVTKNIPEVFTFVPTCCEQIKITSDILHDIGDHNIESHSLKTIHISIFNHLLDTIENMINDILYSDGIWDSEDTKISKAVHDLKRMLYLTMMFKNYYYCKSSRKKED